MWENITVNVSVPISTVSGASCRMLKFMHDSSTGTAASPCRVQTLVEQGQGQGLTYLLTNTCQNTLNHVRRWRFTTPHHNTYGMSETDTFIVSFQNLYLLLRTKKEPHSLPPDTISGLKISKCFSGRGSAPTPQPRWGSSSASLSWI